MRVGAFEIVEPVPELHETYAIAMLRPWIDVGRVGTLALTRLEKHLGAKELGRLARPGTFFDFTRYRPRTRIEEGRRVLTTPNTIVYHARDSETGRDYLFLHLREPHAMAEDYTDSIMTLLKHFDVQEYCRIGGMYDSVPHTRPLLVTGTLREDQAEIAKGLVAPQWNQYQGPTSIIGLVGEGLAQLEVSSPSLMVHLPQYAQLEDDHMGASRLMEVLSALYGFPKLLADPALGVQQYKGINRAVESNAEVKGLIRQLETYYDRVLAASRPEDVSFSPDMEKFLKEMSERLDGGQTPEDDE